MATAVELNIDTNATATAMANAIFGNGATVDTASYTGDRLSSGIFTDGNTTSPGVVPGDSGVILSSGYVTDFTNSNGSANTNTATNTSTNTSGSGDADFTALAGAATYDAAFLEIDFTPTGDFLTIDFVLSSEEYPEYVNSQFNDVVGVWVNGVQATVTIGNGSASVGNINGGLTENLYNDNTGDAYNTEMDGFTITLTFIAPVNVGQVNTLKIGVADVADSQYDTNLLIAGGSVQSTIVAQDDSATTFANGVKTVDVLGNDSSSGGALTVTKINGIAVTAGDTVTLSTGQQIILNANGTLGILGDADTETVYFTYSVQDTSGNTDTAIVKVSQIACFVEGSLIETPDGKIRVEDLRAGDLVLTLDHGPQPIRWVGGRTVTATGTMAPIHLRKGTLGLERDLWLSPQHRVFLSGPWAEMLFGEAEVLVKAKYLVNDSTVRVDSDRRKVRYFHILFNRHQIINSEGLWSESYLPAAADRPGGGAGSESGFDAGVQQELEDVFPEMMASERRPDIAARPSLKRHEARALTSLSGMIA